MPTAAPFTILLTNAAGQVMVDPAGFLRLHWSDSARSLADTQAMFTTAAQALSNYEWSHILINQVHMPAFTSQEQLWISETWLPAAVRQNGYRAGAVVVAANVLTRLATAFVTASNPDLPLRYRSFDLETLAIEWLLAQPV